MAELTVMQNGESSGSATIALMLNMKIFKQDIIVQERQKTTTESTIALDPVGVKTDTIADCP